MSLSREMMAVLLGQRDDPPLFTIADHTKNLAKLEVSH